MSNLVSRIWSTLENHPWLTMIVGVLAQTWFTLNNRALWFSDEVRYANAYQNLVQNGKWMVLSLNGQPYPDKPPVYFWFLWLLDKLTPADMPTIFFMGAALSGLFFLMAAYALARVLDFNKTVSLSGVLILLSTFLLAGLFHYSRMDLMFAALIVLSHACFFKAFKEDHQGLWPLYGFLLAGIATLTKGPLGFIFPLITCAIYLLWKGRIRKFFSRQMGLGLLAMLAMLALWVVGVILVEGQTFLVDTVLGKHVIQRATKTFHHREPFYYYMIAFPLAWLPWSLFCFVTPIKRIFSTQYWGRLWASRCEASPRAFLWIMFLSIFVFLSSLSGKVLIYILPMFPPLAFLIGDAMTRLDDTRTRRFWTIVAVLWGVFGIGLFAADTLSLLPFPVPLQGITIAAAVMLLGSGIIFFARTKGNKAGILGSVLAMTLWLYPVGLLVAPSLDDGMSPIRQAKIIGEYANNGYAPMAYKIYSGIFTYYSGHNQAETGDFDELNSMIANEDKIILSIRRKHWEEWKNMPEDCTIMDEQNFAGMDYLLVIKD